MKRQRAANSRRMVGRGNVGTWLLQHVQAAVSSLGRCNRHLLSTFMTVAVIGIALALPTALHVLLDNLTRVSNNWFSKSRSPSALAESPRPMKTAEKPAMNRPVSRATGHEVEPPDSLELVMSRPVMTDR